MNETIQIVTSACGVQLVSQGKVLCDPFDPLTTELRNDEGEIIGSIAHNTDGTVDVDVDAGEIEVRENGMVLFVGGIWLSADGHVINWSTVIQPPRRYCMN